MPEWTGTSRGGTLGYRFFFLLIRYTNLRLTYFFVRVVAVFYLVFSNKTAVRYYFRVIHGYGPWKTLWSIYGNYCMLGEMLIDKVAVLSGWKTGFRFTLEGEEHLLEMGRRGEGGVLIGAHMGNWEVAGKMLEGIDTPVHIVMLEAERKEIREMMERTMVRRNLSIISRGEGYDHLFQIDEALRKKEIVVLHGDRFLEGANTVELPFMGRPALFPAGPLYLASKHGVPVSFVFTMKEGRRHYHFYATAPRTYPYPARVKNRKEELRIVVADYVRELERMVALYPLQWFNFYPFWKREAD
jgi:predicted LPLAT superfamily acyltransferase